MSTQEERIEALQEQIRQKQARIRQIKAKGRAEERKARNHAAIVIGGLVLSHVPGGDWRLVDWDALASLFSSISDQIAACVISKPEGDDAARRLAAWEAKGRESKENQPSKPQEQPISKPEPDEPTMPSWMTDGWTGASY